MSEHLIEVLATFYQCNMSTRRVKDNKVEMISVFVELSSNTQGL